MCLLGDEDCNAQAFNALHAWMTSGVDEGNPIDPELRRSVYQV